MIHRTEFTVLDRLILPNVSSKIMLSVHLLWYLRLLPITIWRHQQASSLDSSNALCLIIPNYFCLRYVTWLDHFGKWLRWTGRQCFLWDGTYKIKKQRKDRNRGSSDGKWKLFPFIPETEHRVHRNSFALARMAVGLNKAISFARLLRCLDIFLLGLLPE